MISVSLVLDMIKSPQVQYFSDEPPKIFNSDTLNLKCADSTSIRCVLCQCQHIQSVESVCAILFGLIAI